MFIIHKTKKGFEYSAGAVLRIPRLLYTVRSISLCFALRQARLHSCGVRVVQVLPEQSAHLINEARVGIRLDPENMKACRAADAHPRVRDPWPGPSPGEGRGDFTPGRCAGTTLCLCGFPGLLESDEAVTHRQLTMGE
ncbi:hypothetical protein NDU88_000580 [Pleurodeles waltl]|uniref:Uncharacterized protein n=1 Tax=Pleurodeles waltl TaxID=8319 RepID=A0AAV7LYJ1_PLEWA|nr:hypothetical protein NDU88_000580 [Pleurodeles waltl]